MKLFVGWMTSITVLASPCAWDTSQRELLARLQQPQQVQRHQQVQQRQPTIPQAIATHDLKESA